MNYKYGYTVNYVAPEDDYKEHIEYGMLYADTLLDAAQQIVNYYGEDDLTKVELVPLDDTPLFFADEEAYKKFINGEYPFKE